MFQLAIKKASQFTFPITVGFLLEDGQIHRECGTYVLLNEQGWCFTAYHVLKNLYQHIQGNLPKIGEKKIVSCKLAFNNSFIEAKTIESQIVEPWDLIYFKAESLNGHKFEPPKFKIYPNIKDMHGLSVCNYGFPFPEQKETYTDTEFNEDLGLQRDPFSCFGSVASFYEDKETLQKHFVTSFPSIQGQSGGPVIDTDGNIVGITQQTFFRNLQLDKLLGVKKTLDTGISLNASAMCAALRKTKFFNEKKLGDDTCQFL
ncbi:MAG: hypothetical protein BA863_02170 [Desulfovibrio sp. S3730MH75]|nr:MAG: hypothetical protein BA863_02170 [Desulfovibrio sp. S3730MH75]